MALISSEDETSMYVLLETKGEDSVLYTKDGTVDYLNNPANKLKTGNWKACFFIVATASLERLAYYGMSSNLLLYFTGELDQHSATASRNLSNWTGACYITPLFGAFLADGYIGKYWTIASSSILYAIGMALLTLSASAYGLLSSFFSTDVFDASEAQTVMCFTSLYLVALASGGIKACISAYGADQFDDDDKTEKKVKSSFFNWYYQMMNIGTLIAHSLIVWVQDYVSWIWGFGIPTLAMTVGVVSFFSGTWFYRNHKPAGSPLTRLFQVVVASVRKRRVNVPTDALLLYEIADANSTTVRSRKLNHTSNFSFFDKAAVETPSDHAKGSVNPWTLCTVTQIEELKSVLRLLPIWVTGIVFSSVRSQMDNLFVLQGSFMDTQVGKTSFKIPPASLGTFGTLSVIFWVPVYDQIIVPLARKLTGHPNGLTQLQRIGTGHFISIFSMLSAGILEVIRLEIVKRHGYYEIKPVPISIFWQVPQFLIIGCAEVFTLVGQMEFFYEQVPGSMKSLGSALRLTTIALGNYTSSLLVSIVIKVTTEDGGPGWIPDNLNYGQLQNFFWLLAALSGVNLAIFVVVAKWHTGPLG
ncbi:protein NRT1/ PTR FAMILY 8.2 isoform X3 [Helianthus annuus]|uniref:Putative proton-dependent oligopeptide transporter family n=1 Tax=Helianthus annuus TaxID=4232 RepID=A0A251ULV9_HELAN|nr:protein NRT1/ PTR FAMILY 8.2 isoform X3 [Helianthus annuus]